MFFTAKRGRAARFALRGSGASRRGSLASLARGGARLRSLVRSVAAEGGVPTRREAPPPARSGPRGRRRRLRRLGPCPRCSSVP